MANMREIEKITATNVFRFPTGQGCWKEFIIIVLYLSFPKESIGCLPVSSNVRAHGVLCQCFASLPRVAYCFNSFRTGCFQFFLGRLRFLFPCGWWFKASVFSVQPIQGHFLHITDVTIFSMFVLLSSSLLLITFDHWNPKMYRGHLLTKALRF